MSSERYSLAVRSMHRARRAVMIRPSKGPKAHRLRVRALVLVALALSVLFGATAAGAVGGLRLVKGPTAHHGSKATSAPRTNQLDRGQVATDRGNDYRDGWYPDQPGLTPELVSSSSFGQLFATQLNGQIYAQPLLVGKVLLVTTETDWIYGLNPVTGAIEWSRRIGTPFLDKSLGCADLTPDLGVTSTPAIDPSTGIAYVVNQAFAGQPRHIGWFMNAFNPATGAEMPHFPVEIKGPANNNPKQLFAPTKELQRPGLLFLGGVVYAAFGSHCDFPPFAGYIVGVSTGGRQATMWTDESTGTGGGGGIWQTGDGLISDGPGQILFASGNGFGTTSHPDGPIPGTSPPANLADSVVRLVVQPDGSLKAKSFFSMYNDVAIDRANGDLVGEAALPAQFSAPKYPHLLVVTGKEGFVYLLDRDRLGGVAEGPGGKDLVLEEYGPIGNIFSSAGTWPGNGGYVYISTVSGVHGGAGKVDAFQFTTSSNGLPSLRLVGMSSEPTFFGVSGPVITSAGTTSGTAVMWVVSAGNLQAYDPVPVHGKLALLGSWSIGSSVPFNPPGIGNNTLYVGDMSGMLYGFGKKVPGAGGARGTRS